jgi:D-3-phosphoglycerate dehydrogenase / 2-oxoglutarate reductase
MSSTLEFQPADKPTSMERHKIKFVLLEGIHESAVRTLRAAGYSNLETYPTALEGSQLVEAIRDAAFVGLRSRTQMTAEMIEAAERLLAIGCFCIGTNQVDLDAAMWRGIPVFNAPYSNTRSVAELVIAQAILLLRRIPERNAMCHQGYWDKTADRSYELRGKTLGIIGYGNIGTQLSVMAEALGMRVIFCDVVTKLPLGNAQQVDRDYVLAHADVVSLHVPETADTINMIGRRELQLMKHDAVLINASRGQVVDISALEAALENKSLLGAAIDVFPTEPKSSKEEFQSPLRRFQNVILTPHIGGSTVEAQANIGIEVAEKLVRYCDNGTTLSSVNFPEVSLPSYPNKHRLLHLHENRPGILSAINQTLSELQINISGQYLQTFGEIGYVVVDIDAQYSERALAKIREIPGTIRCRVLW